MSRRFWATLALPLFALACESQNSSLPDSRADYDATIGSAGGEVMAEANQAPAPSAVARNVAFVPAGSIRESTSISMIIRTGNASIEVESLEVAVEKLQRLAEAVGGYIANSAIHTGEGQQRQSTLEIKIPSSRYDQAVGGLSGIGKLISSSSNAQDVGEEFVDITARVANAKRMEERLVTLLATRTGKLDDVLAVERELARVREEIERYEGRLRFLRTQVSMSSLSVMVSEPGPVVGHPGSNVIVEALKQSWRNFVYVIAGGIEMLGGLLPVLVLGVIAWIGVRKWRGRRPVTSQPVSS